MTIAAGTKPKIVSSMKDVKVIAPKPATLTCDISPGDPRPKVMWYKNGKEIRANRKYDMSYEGNSACLVVKDTEVNDGAVYTCAADNKVGLVETEGKLTVQGRAINMAFSPRFLELLFVC